MRWIGQNIYDQVSRFRNTVDFAEDVTFYQPVNDANPQISIGANDNERLRIFANYQGTTTQSLQQASFVTYTESGTADDGSFSFSVDEVGVLQIRDAGLYLLANKGISIAGTDILTDSSGTATLSNIDALDATTIATFNANLTAGDITSIVAGTGLTGSSLTSGDATLNVIGGTGITANANDIAITAGGVDTTQLADNGVTENKLADTLLAEIDANTAKATNVVGNLTATASGVRLTVATSNGNNVDLPAATNSAWGIMSDDLVTALEANTAKNTNVVTNLSVASSTGSRVIASSDGTNATIPIATTSVSGVMSTAIFDEHTANNAKATNRAYFEFKGYGISDGTNYEMPEIISDNNAPFQHDTSTGSDGLDAQTVNVVMRQGGIVMPYAGVLKKFNGWVTTQGTGTVDIGIFKFTPVDNNAGNVTPGLLVNEQITGAGNTKMRYFSETSSFNAGFAAGDVIYSAVLGGGSNKSWYLNSMLEVEWS